MGSIRRSASGVSQFYAVPPKNAGMKIPTARTAFATRAKRGLGQVVLALLFLISVFQLAHLPAMATNHAAIEGWRVLAVGSLFLFFCVPSSGRPCSGK
jgi:hypothetical protein